MLRSGLMRAAVAGLFCAAHLLGQPGLWSHVGIGQKRLEPVGVTDSEEREIQRAIRAAEGPHKEAACQDGDGLNLLRYSAIELAPSRRALLVEAGPGCRRGGQGSNGDLWLVEMSGGRARILLASSGWLYSVETSKSHGYRDVILGWHMSCCEQNLSYLRFDSLKYRAIGGAKLLTDDQGVSKIVPGK